MQDPGDRMTTRAVRRRLLGMTVVIAMTPALAMQLASRGPSARAGGRTVWDSVYSATQATTGEARYGKSCARCHGASLGGIDEAPPLAGSAFLGNWDGLALSDLQTRIKTTMPSDSVGIYDRQLVTDVMAYLLKSNGFPAGASDLPSDIEPLKDIVLRTTRP
jgi:mono/diheme cytochrome c family protein